MAHPAIDIDGLHAALARCESMIAYHGANDHKAAQNAAMKAAGLPPLHSETQLNWDAKQLASYAREAEALRGVIAYFGEATSEAA